MSSIIRLARPDDAPGVRAIYAPFVRDSAVSFETDVPDDEEMRRRIETTIAERPWLVLDHGGDILGYAYASRHRERAAYRWCAETSAYVAPAWRGRGIGRGLYESLLAVLDLLGYHNAIAGITLPNEASVALHRACGFELVGVYRAIGYKLGAWHDVAWWQRSRGDRSTAPAPPRAMADTIGTPALAEALRAGESHLGLMA